MAITGASGALGQALLRAWHRRGAQLVALTSSDKPLEICDQKGMAIPLRQVSWQVGKEEQLAPLLAAVDVLVLNHGINSHQDRSQAATARCLEVNALSSWRLAELMATTAKKPGKEIWINTSEAEIQPAASPLYEISKRLLGHLISLRALDWQSGAQPLRIRRLVLGPFRSNLNPIGVMGADFVANQILNQANWGYNLIIVTPNPLTYLLMPIATVGRWLYNSVFTKSSF
ncbi:SDR family NAD(P)-dependent oxidoreductase [Cyanobium sp. HWJ4-Hawea]|uniref:SDR family NAD(P)-dependent oxidoreductase n=1 Tax=Cyanobium sp. HWJ4-Hawea TaxID=2823713 RepID=UPI0020CFCEB9|nr:SDR family NAD(P)-dependent oxidoreductase [Cyanobium sp. HWJ4-Hawea]MCP9808835.1 SDR family NAD(P)-dependent oxidoreductase [Cyanobium sp. HWJ4-Hawea]